MGYCQLLTDARGVTVDFIGDLALEVHLDDHFDATHIPLTCTTSPVFDPQGRLTAVLDISALSSPQDKNSQHLALQLVKIYAGLIKNAKFLHRYRRDWILRLSESPEFVDVSPRYLLALDAAGHVIGPQPRGAAAAGDRDGGLVAVRPAIRAAVRCAAGGTGPPRSLPLIGPAGPDGGRQRPAAVHAGHADGATWHGAGAAGGPGRALAGALFGARRQVALPVAQLAVSKVPLTLVWGREDCIIPAGHAAHAPAGATAQVLDGAGHMVMMGKAGGGNGLILAQLKGAAPS
jgi:pimeloyl-ACP methyl ester carboxylesterase